MLKLYLTPKPFLALDNNTFASSTALDTAETVSNLAWIAKKVIFTWTRAHVGTEGNELADYTAKQAAHNNANL